MCIHENNNFKAFYRLVNDDDLTLFIVYTCQICGWSMLRMTLPAIMLDEAFALTAQGLKKIPLENPTWLSA